MKILVEEEIDSIYRRRMRYPSRRGGASRKALNLVNGIVGAKSHTFSFF